jgi:molybdopterin synthase sulfur carrier subunit
VNLVFLGRFRDLAALRLPQAVPPDIATLGALKNWLKQQYPALSETLSAARTQIVVNHVVVRDDSHLLHAGDEVAFLPPMSGG